MRRRLRALTLVSDLQRLSDLGLDVASSAGEQTALAVGLFRANTLAGQFDHLALFVDPAKAAVDVGANAGAYALKLAALCPRVVVIEPQAALGWLARTLPANCLFYPCAAGAAAGTAELAVPLRDGTPQRGQGTLTAVSGPAAREQVAVRPLDEILADCCADEPVGFIKIDAEGWSTAVLRGAAQTVARWRPNLQVELWPDERAETAALLAGWGYRGLFFYEGLLHDIGRFDPAVHAAAEHAWQPDNPDAFDPTRYVGDFFFIPA